jgi:hypothetical protein
MITCQELCDKLLKLQQDFDIKNVPDQLKYLVSFIWPEKFKHEPTSQQPQKEECVKYKLPFGTELLVMLSGGIGSTSALWNVISRGRDAGVLFVEGKTKSM